MKLLKVTYYIQGNANKGYLHSFVNIDNSLKAVILKEDGTITQQDYHTIKVGDLVNVIND